MTKQLLIKTLFFSVFALTLTSCASISTVQTNLDKENFEHYFSPSRVTIYNDEKAFSGKAQLIGMVEGENCQAKPHLAEPDKIEARTQARRAAYQQGANAIVFSGCAQVTTKECHAQIICYGKAYYVEKQ